MGKRSKKTQKNTEKHEKAQTNDLNVAFEIPLIKPAQTPTIDIKIAPQTETGQYDLPLTGGNDDK